MGAGGRDFHVFNTCYRENSDSNVVAFTAAQIPNIDNRIYPASLAGEKYSSGIPIFNESELSRLIEKNKVDEVIFAYSDVSNSYVSERRKFVKETGSKFKTFDVDKTMIKSTKPVVAVCAVRTGAGKSPTSRKVAEILRGQGKRVVAIRHPMPYGDLERQVVQRYETLQDMKKHECTIEEMEEYEPHIKDGVIVYAGVDYEKVLRAAEKEADVILWDGGNNDTPFIKPDRYITIVDPLRAGDELKYFPSKENLVRADLLIINKIDEATDSQFKRVLKNARNHNPNAKRIHTTMNLTYSDDPEKIRGKKVLVVEDGPTLTHGNMQIGAGMVAARNNGAEECIDPRPFVTGKMAETYESYPKIGSLLPAMGYSEEQVKDLETTINNTPADLVIVATPIDLGKLIKIDKPSIKIGYELREFTLGLDEFLSRI